MKIIYLVLSCFCAASMCNVVEDSSDLVKTCAISANVSQEQQKITLQQLSDFLRTGTLYGSGQSVASQQTSHPWFDRVKIWGGQVAVACAVRYYACKAYLTQLYARFTHYVNTHVVSNKVG